MEQDKLSNNMDVIVVIDKEKLPEDVRKILEDNLPKDAQEKVIEMLQKGKIDNITSLEIDKEDKLKDTTKNNLFAIQTGTVIGNIYTDGIYKKEEEKNKDIDVVK